ncbi:MAG: hypothetical protein M1833_001869 [Piccolia ochrophora]|nr:MAG: hypothetical protein M1833_001869 [Piccolia ochrophora]
MAEASSSSDPKAAAADPTPTSAENAPSASGDPSAATPASADANSQPAVASDGPGGPAIEPDDYSQTDGDSAYGDGTESYTTSLASSILNYKYENGRRYHAFRDGEYFLPNDESEQDRLDLIHHLHRLIINGKLHIAPIGKNPGRVLDIGTGTGIWSMEFADEYPSAEVIGTDLSPIQPTCAWRVPPNLKIEIDDAETSWAYTTPFDYIHMRTLHGSIKDWPKLLVQAYDNLAPGGWIESQEYETTSRTDDDTFPKPSALLNWIENLNKAAATFGKPTNIAHAMKKYVEDAGFINVTEQIYKVPMSPWAKDPKLKEQGRFNQLAMLESLQAYTLRLFTGVLGWSTEEAEVTLVNVRKELKDQSIHNYST